MPDAIAEVALRATAYPLAANCLSRLGGVALAARQFALLNPMRNTDIFFVGSKKNRGKNQTVIFKGMVVLPITNGSLHSYRQGGR